jgi:hypothetical protein
MHGLLKPRRLLIGLGERDLSYSLLDKCHFPIHAMLVELVAITKHERGLTVHLMIIEEGETLDITRIARLIVAL